MDGDPEGGAGVLKTIDGPAAPALRRGQASALWRWMLGAAMDAAGRGVDGLAVDILSDDKAGREAVKRWTATRKGVRVY